MRIGVAGKGGVGKSTLTAAIARTLARRGEQVIAIDCDSDANLGTSLGLTEDQDVQQRPLLEQDGRDRQLPEGLTLSQVVDAYGTPAPDGVTLLLGARAEVAGSGCTGASHVHIRDLIRDVDNDLPGASIVADMQAGIEHLSWAGGTLAHVDLLLVVVQMNQKVLITADRMHRLAVELGIPRVAFVASAVDPSDQDELAAFAADHGVELVGLIPDDDAVRDADRNGACLLDWAPESPSARALDDLVDTLSVAVAA